MPFDMSALLKATRKPKAGPKVPRRATIVQAIADVIQEDWRNGTCPTLLTYEGAIWAALRSGLCLEGMRWPDADRAARDMLQEAFAKTGAKRPSWKEGQPEWTDGGVIRDTRTTCVNCGKGLEGYQKLYCSKICADAHWQRMDRAENAAKYAAIDRLKNMRRRAAGEREGAHARSERWKDARDRSNPDRA